MRRTWVAIVSLVGACAEEPKPADTKNIIALELEGGWTDQERHAVENAAETWNLEFGTRLRVAEFGDENRVPLSFTDGACANSRNQATHAQASSVPPDIRICPRTAEDPALLFETIRHELGHILGIPVHANDSYAVMTGRATNLVHWFRDEDRDLFFGANAGWAGQTGCSVSPRIADGTPLLAHPADHPIHMIWAKDETIRIAPISKIGLLGGEVGRITTAIAASRVDAHPTDNGFLVTWFEENRINLASIGLPDGITSEPRSVELDWPLTSFSHVSEQHAPPYYWLAVTVRENDTNTSRTLHLFQFDGATGAIIESRPFPMTIGELVLHEGQPFLISGERDLIAQQNRVRIHRIQARPDGFDLTESIDVASIPLVITEAGATAEPILTAQSTAAGILMLLETSSDVSSIDLVRVTTQSQLAVEKSFTIHVGALLDPVMLEAHDHVFIGAVMPSPTHYENELYLLQLSPDTLEAVEPWRLLSAADTLGAAEPRLAASGEHIVAVWSEASGDVRSRCVRLAE